MSQYVNIIVSLDVLIFELVSSKAYLLYLECLFTAICQVLPYTEIRFDMLVGHPDRGPSFAVT